MYSTVVGIGGDLTCSRHAERVELFGGVVGDDVSLCEAILEVVFHFFGGLDYTDP